MHSAVRDSAGVDDIEGLVERTVASVLRIVNRVVRWATLLLVAAVVIDVGSFWLGMEALSGGIESVWAVLGVVFAAIAIACAFVARWRLGRVRRHVPELVSDVRSLVSKGPDTAHTVIDVFDNPSGGPATFGVSRSVVGMKGLAGTGLAGSAKLTQAVIAITSFPWLALVTVAITSVFGFLALVFLIALAL
jgi:hypothetical protein